MLLKAFIIKQLQKAGRDINAAELQTVINNLPAELDLPDELANSIDTGLLSVQQAMNNHPQIGGHYRSQVYNGLDNELNTFIQSADLDETTMAEIAAEKSSTKRAVLIATKIRELTEKKTTTNTKGEKEDLNRQIVELNNQLRAIKDSLAAKDQAHAAALTTQQVNFKKGLLLQGYKTIHDTMDPSTRDIILNSVIDKHMKAQNAKWATDANGELIITTQDGNNLFTPENVSYTAKGFIDYVLGTEKFIVVNNANGGNGNQQNNPGSNNGQHFNGQHRQQNGSTYNPNQNNGQNQNNGGGNRGNGGGGNSVLKNLVQEALSYQPK